MEWGGGKSIRYLLTICGFKASWDFKFEYDRVSSFSWEGGGGAWRENDMNKKILAKSGIFDENIMWIYMGSKGQHGGN